MKISELKKFDIRKENISLYFITKKENYSLFCVEIDDALQSFFAEIVNRYLEVNEKSLYSEFNSENEDSLYNLKSNQTMKFDNLICKQFGKKIEVFDSLSKTKETGNIVAYCINIRDETIKDNFYCFRKVSRNKFGIDENGSKKSRKARFDTTTGKLITNTEPIFSFDGSIDFIYKNEEFLISNKSNFEIITSYYDVYNANSTVVLNELSQTGMFIDISGFQNIVVSNKNYQKRLSKVYDLGNYKNFNKKSIKHMSDIAKKYGGYLKIEDNKIKLEDSNDYDLLCRLLADYYKIGEVSGESYGTFSGEIIKTS